MIADLLSFSRIILGILFILLAKSRYSALAIVILAGLTDILDGILARKYGGSKFGRILDPGADKIFALSVIIGLIINYKLNVLYGVLILSRDIMNSIILPGLYVLKARKNIPETGKFGKAMTWVLFISFILIILDFYSSVIIFIAIIASILTAIYSLILNFP